LKALVVDISWFGWGGIWCPLISFHYWRENYELWVHVWVSSRGRLGLMMTKLRSRKV